MYFARSHELRCSRAGVVDMNFPPGLFEKPQTKPGEPPKILLLGEATMSQDASRTNCLRQPSNSTHQESQKQAPE